MKHTKLIEKYLQNKASAEELKEINRLLKEDAAFKANLYFHINLREAVRREEGKLLKEQLKSLGKQKKNGAFFPVIWKIAAVFVIGLGILWFYNQPNQHEKIFNEYFEAFPNIEAPSVRDFNTTESIEAKAFNLYDGRDYANAAKTFEKLAQENDRAYANFYLAISLMADNQIEKAINVLENPDWEIPEKYQEQTDWYLALGYLKINDSQKASEYLKKLSKTDSMLATKAKEIIDDIE